MSYVVAKIVKEAEVAGKWGPQIRTAFTVNEFGNEKVLSCFSKYPLKEGQTIEGTIETQEKEGKTYHNFKFAPKTYETKASPSFQPSGDILRVERKLDDILTKYGLIQGTLSDMKGVLSDILSKLPQEEQF